MSSELSLKKLRGYGGYVMARVSDEQQTKGNLGGPDLFLAPIGRLSAEFITKHFCNTCKKEFEGSPKIEFKNPNEKDYDRNLILVEKGQYICNSCNSPIAEYREFKKQNESEGVGSAKPIEQVAPSQVENTPQVESAPQVTNTSQIDSTSQETVTTPSWRERYIWRPWCPVTSVTSIEGRAVYDENANKIGIAKQVGIDSTQSMVLVITQNDGSEGNIPWKSIKKVGEIILLGKPRPITSIEEKAVYDENEWYSTK